MKSGKLTADRLAPHLASANADLRAEALRLATARPEWGGSLAGFLEQSLESEVVSPALGEALLAFSENGEVQKLIASALKNIVATSPETLRHRGKSPAQGACSPAPASGW